MELPKRYEPRETEKKWQDFWLKKKTYKFNKETKKKIFSLDTPPPTVSGTMHLGHAMAYSQADFIMRFKRMQGFEIFYPWGFDDNGLATERFVERENKIKSTTLSRKEFVDLCLKTTKKAEENIKAQFISTGISPDFDLTYRTIEPKSQKISQLSFIDLYEKGREYRAASPIMWCPECRTAISQVELKDKSLNSKFNDIIFKVGNKDLVIATTRPELLPACVGLFYHPDDKRYKKLKGKKATVPLFNYEVEIREDKRVDIEKGTGIVMCCTFGDQTDIEWFKAHKLDLKIAISPVGKMTELSGKYEGLKIKDARKEIIEDLEASKLLVSQKDISHPVNVHERCDTPIEFMVSKQWFIKYLDLKKEFLKLGSQLNWSPKHMKVRYDNWVKGLAWDWCISRQRFFGVPIPVWYCEKCDHEILADKSQLPVDPLKDKPITKKCPKCGHNKFTPEKDVLDTWATSSLTPMIAAGWNEDEKLFKKIFPMSIRSNGHDIITFWLFNTVVKSHLHEGKLPWKDVIINGFLVDKNGEKMSKSRGNVIKPEDVLEKFSSDALRYWAASSKLGADLAYQEKELLTGMKLLTKLWNASKFVHMHLEDYKNVKPKKIDVIDKFLLSKVQGLISEVTNYLETYEFSKARASVENFFWHTFCDNYLEMIKYRIYNPDIYGKDKRVSAQYALFNSLYAIMKMFAPILPHITEEIYTLFFKPSEKIDSIHLSDWPKPDLKQVDKKLEENVSRVIDIISRVRKYKSENSLSLKAEVENLVIDKKLENELSSFIEVIKETTKSKKITFGKGKLETEEFKIKISI
jgi:valyl-tRNA synthetase